MTRTSIFAHCFDEADRSPVADFEEPAARAANADFLLVKDGSTDATLNLLRGLRVRHSESFAVLDLQPDRERRMPCARV